MDALKALLASKKTELGQAKSSLGSGFLKRGAIQSLKDEEYAKLEAERQKKKKIEHVEVSEMPVVEVVAPVEEVMVLTREELTSRLRSLNQPIRLFGETDLECQKRLHQVELVMHEREAGSSVRGQKNTFQQIMNSSIQQEIQESIAFGSEHKDQDNDSDDEASAIEAFAQMFAQESQKSRSQFDSGEKFVLAFLKRAMKVWELELESRPEAEKRTSKGKSQKATWHQTKQYLKPLYKALKRKSLDKEVSSYLETIILKCCDREFVLANDIYMQLAIGNAPWPVGVSNSGIHERSADDKLKEVAIAHVLNDEMQRKYIQSVKRLMTFAQLKYPNLESNAKNCG